MMDAIEGIVHTRPFDHSTAETEPPIRPKPQSAATDTTQIRDAAKVAMDEDREMQVEAAIKANLGDIRAQRLIEEAAAKKKLLGLDSQ